MTNKRVSILDCTLRDGGYVNNWEFDARTVERVIDGLYDAGVRYIELGIMGKGGEPGKSTKFSDFAQIRRFLARRRPGCRYAVMLNQAEAHAFEIPPRAEDTVDLIRIAFFKKEREAALEKACELKAKGYEVFLQAMATFMYDDGELAALIADVNEAEPAGFYLVDSFSTLYNEDVRRMADFVLARLSENVLFGFHAHNNIQMAYSNAIEFLSSKTDRPLIADGSIYGMGRGAGNVPTELLMEYLNKVQGGAYNTLEVLALFEETIRPIFREHYWGFSPEYFLTAQKNMNSVYGWYFGNRGVKNLRALSTALDAIPEETRYTLNRAAADAAIETPRGKGRPLMTVQAKELRKRILSVAYMGRDANLQSCFSSIEILYALYHCVMNWSPETAKSPERDYFILSKGQSSLALSVVLEEKGVFREDELNTFCKFGSRFSMQLDRTKFPEGGIENSAGSLGHGFPMAVGLANACRIRGGGNRVYVLAGDGEMNEGTMWEACAFASGHKLDNLTLIIDDNDSIGRMLDLSPLRAKLEAFGFFVSETDGHDVEQLKQVLNECKKTLGKPQAVIAHTVRGYGSKSLMSDNSWFHRAPSAQELEMLKKEVEVFEKSDD